MRASSHIHRTARHPGENHLVALPPLDLSRRASLLDGRIVGDSEPMRRLKLLVAKVAASHSTALITGESGFEQLPAVFAGTVPGLCHLITYNGE